MSTLILEGILGSEQFKKYQSGLQLATDPKIFKKFNLKIHCANAVNKLFKDKQFVNSLKGEDEGEETEQSVSVFDSIYRKILFEANKQKFLIKQDEDRKFLVVKKGDSITILDKDHNEVTDPKILHQVTNYIKVNKDEIKAKNAGDKASKELDKFFSIDALSDSEGTFTETLASFNTGINEDAITDDVYKKLLSSLKLDIYKQKAIKANYKEDQLKTFSDDLAKLLAAVFAAKFVKVNGGSKEDVDKKKKFKQFVEQAKKFQAQLPAAEIAKVCDLPGSSDVKISTNTKMYDINGKESNKWTLDEEIDSDDEIQQWRAFLNTGDGTDTPAHPEAIAAAIAQQLAGLAEASGSTLDGIDAANAVTGLATAAVTGGLSLPIAITISVTKGVLKKQHVRKGTKLLEDWYNKAMELVNKYPDYTLAKLGKKDAKHGTDIK